MMKRLATIGTVLTVLTLGGIVTAQAGPLPFDQVAADAKWIVHVDFDALRASPVGKPYCEECLKNWPGKDDLHEAREKWGIQPCQDLHSVTLYGTKIAVKHHVMIVRADVDQAKFLEKLKKVAKVKTVEHDGITIHTWKKHKGRKHADRVAMAFFKPDTMVFAPNVDLLKQALDVLKGQAPNLAGQESPLKADIPDGTIFLVRAVGLDQVEMKHKLPVLTLLEQFSYFAGQHEGRWFAELHVVAKSEEVANRLREVFEGHLALLRLHFHDQPGVLGLLDKVQIAVDGRAARMTFEAPVEQVAEQVPTVCKAFQEHWKWHLRMCKKMMYMKKKDEMHDRK